MKKVDRQLMVRWLGPALGLMIMLTACSRQERTTIPPRAAPHSAGHMRMVQRLGEIARLDEEQTSVAMAQITDEFPQSVPVEQRFRAHRSTALAQLVMGENENAIGHYQSAYDLLPQLRGKMTRTDYVDAMLDLAVAYLRVAESENCVACCDGESCLFPVTQAGQHRARRGSENAIKYLEELLGRVPGELRAKWLLNLAYMTLGEYPEGVPARHRIKLREVPANQVAFPRFRNIASKLRLNEFNLSGGVICDDFDNDDDLDIVTSSWAPDGQLSYYRNNGDGTFSNATEAAGLAGIVGGLNLLQADFDNDNDLDVMVLRGAWLGKQEGRQPNSLLKNDGFGRFDDVAYEAGLAGEDFPTQTAAWADYDLDGWLDLYVGNEQFPSQLFRNRGDGTFEDVAKSAGVNATGFTKGVSWGDFDDDGDPDLYVSNLDSMNQFYRNNGDGTFADIAGELNVAEPLQSFPTWFWDFDNDGRLDLWVGSAWWNLEHFVASYMGMKHNAELHRLYRGNETGGFDEVSSSRNLKDMSMPMGSNFGDLDNDGFLDFYLGTGFPEFDGLMPNVMYRNDRGTRFDNVTTPGGFGHLQKGHGIAFADLDNDGDQDIFSQMGGAYPADGFFNSVYENPGFGANFVRLRLVGTQSNRYAVGARIRLDIKEGQESRSIYRWVNSGGSFGANPLSQQIGLGSAARIERLVIRWPGRSLESEFENLPINRLLVITEGDSKVEQRKLSPIQFPADEK